MKENQTKSRIALAAALIAVSAAVLTSCVTSQEREERRMQREQERAVQKVNDRAARFFKSQFSGHSYVLYEVPNTWDGCVRTSVLHDPDCPCGKGGEK